MRLSAILLLAFALFSCKQESTPNTGFPPLLDELTAADYQDGIWGKVLTLLEIPALESTDVSALATSLSVPSTLITDATKNLAQTTAQTSAYVADVAAQKCLEIKSPLTDLNPAGTTPSNGFYYSGAAFTKTPLELKVKVYLMQYKLTGDTAYRTAVVSVPDADPTTARTSATNAAAAGLLPATAVALIGTKSDSGGSYGYPLVLYSHAGSNGLSYSEIALSLGQLQMGHILAAPVFPGEAYCDQYDAGNICTIPKVAIQGSPGPFSNDYVDLLGLYECMKKFAADTNGETTLSGTTAGTENISTKILKISAEVQTQATAAGVAANNNATLLGLGSSAGTPATILVGLGRGATTTALALARAGAINSVLFSSKTDTATVAAQTAIVTAGVGGGFFGCGLIVAPNATFTAGKNRVFLDYWVNESSGLLTPAQQQASEAIPGFSFMQTSISTFRAGDGDDDAKAKLIADFVKNADASMHLGLIHGGLQNFGKQFRAKLLSGTTATKTAAAAQGAGFILHGTKDQVSDISSSQIFSSIATSTSTTLQTAALAPGVNWLSLAVSPPAAAVNADGSLISATDYGHIGDASFLGGTTGVYTGMSTTTGLSTTAYINKVPAEAVANWLVAQCYPALLSDAVP